jgi:hypothetical protein
MLLKGRIKISVKPIALEKVDKIGFPSNQIFGQE